MIYKYPGNHKFSHFQHNLDGASQCCCFSNHKRIDVKKEIPSMKALMVSVCVLAQ